MRPAAPCPIQTEQSPLAACWHRAGKENPDARERTAATRYAFGCRYLRCRNHSRHDHHGWPRSRTGGVIGQAIGFLVVLARNVRNAELEAAGQLAAGPVQGVQEGTATGI